MKIKYNSPVVLTFTFISAAVLLLQYLVPGLIPAWFAVGGKGSFRVSSLHSWITLFTHVIGHSGWDHLMSNFSIILLIGPILEETYGSRSLLFMSAVTALVTGLLNVFLFSTGLLGASGIVFMMILLASFTNFKKGEIPLTFILVVFLYLGREIINSLSADSIAQFAHIAGGFCGSLFGFFRPGKKSTDKLALV
jgi:membrane associated rhomboid family serine protease